MGRKGLFGVLIAIVIFGAAVLTVETSIAPWQVILGFFLAVCLGLGFANLRNAFVLFLMALILLLTAYFSAKYRWLGVIPGAVAGAATGMLMHFGWITTHKAFLRSEYIKAQEPRR